MIKFSSNDIFWILLFLYYSFGVEKTNTFIRSRGSLVNHDHNGQNLYPFSDQNGSKTIPFGVAHTYIAYIGEYPPPPPGEQQVVLIQQPFIIYSICRLSFKKQSLYSYRYLIPAVLMLTCCYPTNTVSYIYLYICII